MSPPRTAIVTGGAAGIGLETSAGLALLGYDVILTARTHESARRAHGVLDSPPEEWRAQIETNFLGALWTCRAFVPGMVERGFGRVVNVSSDYGSYGLGLEGPAPYSVSKAALNALTIKLAAEVRGATDLKVNAVHPGWVRTAMGGPGADRSLEQGAATVLWLATLPASGPSGGFFHDREPFPW